VLRALSCAIAMLLSLPASAAMQGDAEAIAMAQRMMETMGGAATWSRARWLYAREEAFFDTNSEPVIAEFWRHADAPAEWARRHNPGRPITSAWTAQSGWRQEGTELRALSRESMQRRVGWWPGEIYVMYVRLARQDPALRVEKAGDRAFVVLDVATGQHLGEFGVNAAGEIVRWTRHFGTSRVDYAYGPLRKRGRVRVPDWGSLSDGSFRFYYTDFRLSTTDPPVSFEPPGVPGPAVATGCQVADAATRCGGFAPASDPAAVALAKRMIDQMGKRAAWASARALYVSEEVESATAGAAPERNESWKSFNPPGLWFTVPARDMEFAYSSAGGWRREGSTITRMSAGQLQQRLAGWRGNIYVMYHRLAAEERELRIVSQGERRFVVLDDRSGEQLCWFEVTSDGQLFRWGRSYGRETEEWLYGPPAAFGDIRLPAWGTRLQDGYRFRYLKAELSTSAPPISFERN
jgi:hypothetical protein